MISDRIRKIAESDREAVLKMMRDFYSSDAVMTDGSQDIFTKDIDECISDSPYLNGYVFTDAAGSVKGYAMTARSFSTEFGRPCIWIEDIYLGDDIRGMGLASEFLDYLKEQFPDAVHRLETEPDNERAVGAYRANGFEIIPYMEMIRNTR
jgi:ribosomal protein S18 acetylase RimI-like enzyme